MALAIAFLFVKGIKWPKGFTFCFGVAACIAGFYFLGEAALDYGAARGLAGASADYARELKTNPGRYNAWNFLPWLGALACLAYGTVMVSISIAIPARDFEDRGARS